MSSLAAQLKAARQHRGISKMDCLRFVLISSWLLIGGCVHTMNQGQISELSSELESIAGSMQSCLEESDLIDVGIDYDIVETESLIDPVRGLIEVNYQEAMVRAPDGSPLVAIPNYYQIWFNLGDRGWIYDEVSVVAGRPIDVSGRLEHCLQQTSFWSESGD